MRKKFDTEVTTHTESFLRRKKKNIFHNCHLLHNKQSRSKVIRFRQTDSTKKEILFFLFPLRSRASPAPFCYIISTRALLGAGFVFSYHKKDCFHPLFIRYNSSPLSLAYSLSKKLLRIQKRLLLPLKMGIVIVSKFHIRCRSARPLLCLLAISASSNYILASLFYHAFPFFATRFFHFLYLFCD